MKAVFTYLTGGRSGQAVSVEKSYAMLGRSPQADVRFGPDHDLVVSARHAAVVFRSGSWVLRDLASTNGTFVNGIQVQGEQRLADQDLIRLGDGGPILRFSVGQEVWAPPSASTGPEPIPEEGPPPATTVAAAAVPPTPIAIPYDEVIPPVPDPIVPPRGGSYKVLAGVAALAVIGVIVVATQAKRPAPSGGLPGDDRAVLLARADSLYAAFDSLRARNQLLGNALTGAQSETARLRSRLRRADASGAVLQAIRDSLAALDATRSRLHAAAAMDVAQIARRGDSGVVVLVITWPDGTVRTASAIAAERRGRPVLVTTRAVTVDPDGKAASLAVVVPGTGDVKPTRVTSVNPTLDLALLDAPAGVRPRNTAPLANAEQIRAASVAVMVGYPENAARSADAGTPPPGSSVAALGSVTFSGGNDMELQPYGLTLAPGTAVLDADGRVIGIVLGFARDPQRLRALPATAVSRFLAEGSGAS